MSSKLWDEITYTFPNNNSDISIPNFNGATVEVC